MNEKRQNFHFIFLHFHCALTTLEPQNNIVVKTAWDGKYPVFLQKIRLSSKGWHLRVSHNFTVLFEVFFHGTVRLFSKCFPLGNTFFEP